MSIKETCPVIASVTCDATGCQAVKVPPTDMFDWQPAFRWWLHVDGWSLWAGRGGQRTYCPLHGPKPGHRLWEVPLVPQDLGLVVIDADTGESVSLEPVTEILCGAEMAWGVPGVDEVVWMCSRPAGHDGGCANWPADDDTPVNP